MAWIWDIIWAGLKALLGGWLSGRFKPKDPRDQELNDVQKAHDVAAKNTAYSDADVSKRLSKWFRDNPQ